MKLQSKIFKLVLLVTIIFALYKEIYVNGTIMIKALYYFTIQSNMLVAFCLLLFIFIPNQSRIKPYIRGAGLLAITITGVVYNFILYRIFADWGTAGYTLTRTITHVIAPVGFVLDWILFDKHNMMKFNNIFIWIVYPMLYFVLSIGVSIKYGGYIYFFFNTSNGYGQAFKWLSILVCSLFLIGFIYVRFDKNIGCRIKYD